MFDTMTLTKSVGGFCGAFLVFLLVKWSYDMAWPTITMVGVAEENVFHLWVARMLMVALLVIGLLLVKKAWSHRED